MKRVLRTGFTTGACAAVTSKAACLFWLMEMGHELPEDLVSGIVKKSLEIPFPSGARHALRLSELFFDPSSKTAGASIIKDAGDDPDVTHGALIVSEVRCKLGDDNPLCIKGGEGVGIVTKPGLSVGVGEPAINPVPRKMIKEAIGEVFGRMGLMANVEITISVPEGKRLSKRTLNPRLGIVDGISILGTTGIVKPLSTEAWTDSISTQLKVAKAVGLKECVISTGRTSERAHMSRYQYPQEAYIMAGDFITHAISEAKEMGFSMLTVSAQFGKLIKISLGSSNTHAKYGTLDPKEAASIVGVPLEGYSPNTARELLDLVLGLGKEGEELLRRLCRSVARKLFGRYGIMFCVSLADYKGNVLAMGNSGEDLNGP